MKNSACLQAFASLGNLDSMKEPCDPHKAAMVNVFESKGAPCMEYKYGVKVTIDEQVSEVVEFNEAIMTKIDTSSCHTSNP